MKKRLLLSKSLVVGIILLFIGVAIAPSINFTVAKASNDDGLVEVTTQACGINGFGNTTVKLTKQQYQNLEQYLVDFRARLNQTTTREEAAPIFKDAIVELNKYGLLPKGMSIGQTQKLVITEYSNVKMEHLLQNIYQKHLLVFSNESNSLCMVAGVTSQTVFTGILFSTLYSAASITALSSGFFNDFGLHMLENIANSLGLMFFFSAYILLLLASKLNPPLPIGGITMFGKRVCHGEGPAIYYSSEGWVWTRGLNGDKRWNGSFVGDVYFFNGNGGEEKYYMGAVGFSGLSVKRISNGDVIFLGTALRIAFDTEPPYP